VEVIRVHRPRTFGVPLRGRSQTLGDQIRPVVTGCSTVDRWKAM
jgi:hypothetical protein